MMVKSLVTRILEERVKYELASPEEKIKINEERQFKWKQEREKQNENNRRNKERAVIKRKQEKIYTDLYDRLHRKEFLKFLNVGNLDYIERRSLLIERIRNCKGLEGKNDIEVIIRNPRLLCEVKKIKKELGIVSCELCGHNPNLYWDKIPTLLNLHHKIPLQFRTSMVENTFNDFVLLCPNCHTAIHKTYAKNGFIEWDNFQSYHKLKFPTATP